MFFKSRGILWQNARNLTYIRGWDFSLWKSLADSKLWTKKFLSTHKIAVPETLWIIKRHSENTLERIAQLEPPFVIKPNNWYGWKGIIVVDEKDIAGNFITNSWDVFSPQQIFEHLNYVLDGFFSLSWWRDTVLIEKKIILMKEVDLLWTFGLPDLRIITYNMVPVMAMMRIPTKESGWKANIHGGACAVWIDIGTGKLTYISHKWKLVKSIPGIWDVRGITVPNWEEILSLVVWVQKATGIKFLWCDVVLDEISGPLLLEINIRPWLEIQNVNLSPLKARLDRVEWVEVTSVEKGVRLWRDLFSWDIEERIKNMSWKEILWSREYLKLSYNEKEYNYLAEIRISVEESQISRSFLEDILKVDIWDKKKIRFEWEILGVKKNFRFKITQLEDTNIILGMSSLKGFLVDPYKYKKWETPPLPDVYEKNMLNTAIKKTQEKQLQDIDKKLFDIDKKLLILKYINPINTAEQKQIFIEKAWDYIPKFEYQEVPFDTIELRQKLEKIDVPDIPCAEIYHKKYKEIENKLSFFEAFIDQNTSEIESRSKKIFWDIIDENFAHAKKRLESRDKIRTEDEFLERQEVEEFMKKFNHIYKTKIGVLESDIAARFTMKWDTLMMRRGAQVWKREIRSIIAHEIEGHYLRKLNGKMTSMKIMSRWGARYIETDEGIAIYNQNRFLGEQDKKYYGIFERYYFVAYGMKHSYRRLVQHLCEFYDNDYERVFSYMLRLKRGFKDPSKTGVFMKDVVYVNGFYSVQEYLESWWELKNLYLWKLHIDDIPIIQWESLFSSHRKDILIPFSA